MASADGRMRMTFGISRHGVSVAGLTPASIRRLQPNVVTRLRHSSHTADGGPNGSVLLQMGFPRAQGCCHSIQHARAEHLGLMEEPFRHPVRPM